MEDQQHVHYLLCTKLSEGKSTPACNCVIVTVSLGVSHSVAVSPCHSVTVDVSLCVSHSVSVWLCDCVTVCVTVSLLLTLCHVSLCNVPIVWLSLTSLVSVTRVTCLSLPQRPLAVAMFVLAPCDP